MRRLFQACVILSTLFLTGCCCLCHQPCSRPCCYGPRDEVRFRRRAVYTVAPASACCQPAPTCCGH